MRKRLSERTGGREEDGGERHIRIHIEREREEETERDRERGRVRERERQGIITHPQPKSYG